MLKVPLGCQSLSEPLPFEHLFVSLVLDARAGLQRTVTASCLALLRPDAHANWEHYLLRRICNAGAKAAHCQFQAFKTARRVFSHMQTEKQRLPDDLYQEFVSASPKERLRKLFEEFPKLAEYCDLLMSDWIATVSEFLERLEADRSHFDVHFSGRPFVCPVVGLQAGLSDPHHGGRCVVRMNFENGSKLIYKPRSVALEAHFSDLLEQFNAQEIPHRLRTPQCWERGRYGWMENVVPTPCETLAEVQAFYWRAGALLALVYLARGVDMHRENLIASGEFPVLIDLETLWHPQKQSNGLSNPIATSVLGTGLLPVTNPQTGATYEWNAFGHRPSVEFPAVVWTSVNKDNMRLEQTNRSFQHSNHLPIYADTEHLAGDYLHDLLAGFRWIGEQLLGDHQKRAKFERWIEIIVQCTRRTILRPSLWYQAVLEHLTTPPLLRAKGFATSDLAHFVRNNHPVTQPERQSLQRLEIPWLKQELNRADGYVPMLPAREMAEFLAQESLIVNAFAPRKKGS